MKLPNQSVEPTGGSHYDRVEFVSQWRLSLVAHARRHLRAQPTRDPEARAEVLKESEALVAKLGSPEGAARLIARGLEPEAEFTLTQRCSSHSGSLVKSQR